MSGMTFIFGGVRLLGIRVRFLGLPFFKEIHLLEIIPDLLEIRLTGNLISSKSVKISGIYIYNVVNVKFCSVNKFFFQVVWEFFLLHILALLFFRDLKLAMTRGEVGKLHTEVCVTVSVYVCQAPTCSWVCVSRCVYECQAPTYSQTT